MNIGYPDTKNKQRSGDCGCGSPLYTKYDPVPEVIATSYEGGLADAGKKLGESIKDKREANKKKKTTTTTETTKTTKTA